MVGHGSVVTAVEGVSLKSSSHTLTEVSILSIFKNMPSTALQAGHNQLKLDPNHKYFYRAGANAAFNRDVSYCDFVVWTTTSKYRNDRY